MTCGKPFKTLKGSAVSFVFFMWISGIILFFFLLLLRTDRDGCRAPETETDGNESFHNVSSWPQRKRMREEKKRISIDSRQLVNCKTPRYHPVAFFSLCYFHHIPTGGLKFIFKKDFGYWLHPHAARGDCGADFNLSIFTLVTPFFSRTLKHSDLRICQRRRCWKTPFVKSSV